MMMMIVPQIPFHFPSFLLLLHSLFFLHRLLSLFFSYPANTISFRSFHWIERIETKVINKNNYKMKTMINTRISRFQFDLTSFFLLIFFVFQVCFRNKYSRCYHVHITLWSIYWNWHRSCICDCYYSYCDDYFL